MKDVNIQEEPFNYPSDSIFQFGHQFAFPLKKISSKEKSNSSFNYIGREAWVPLTDKVLSSADAHFKNSEQDAKMDIDKVRYNQSVSKLHNNFFMMDNTSKTANVFSDYSNRVKVTTGSDFFKTASEEDSTNMVKTRSKRNRD